MLVELGNVGVERDSSFAQPCCHLQRRVDAGPQLSLAAGVEKQIRYADRHVVVETLGEQRRRPGTQQKPGHAENHNRL